MKTCKECKKRYNTKGILFCSMICRKKSEHRARNEETKRKPDNRKSYKYIKDYTAIDSGYY